MVEVDVNDGTSREYPSEVEVEHVQTVQEALIYAGVGDIRHGSELGATEVR